MGGRNTNQNFLSYLGEEGVCVCVWGGAAINIMSGKAGNSTTTLHSRSASPTKLKFLDPPTLGEGGWEGGGGGMCCDGKLMLWKMWYFTHHNFPYMQHGIFKST